MGATIESFVQALKEQIAVPKADLEHNIRALLNEMIAKMDLVTQQELVQHQVALQQAQQRIDELSQQLAQIEQSLQQKS